MRNLLRFLTILGVVLGLSTQSKASDIIAQHISNAALVGQGRLSIWFFDIYDASLFAPGGLWESKPPYALSISYLRAVSGRHIADTSAEEIRKLGYRNEFRLAVWHGQMRKIFPDVKEKTVLTGIYTAEGKTLFYENDSLIGTIEDPEFGPLFFDIWLSQKTSEPELRASLLGTP
ncbi:MAG: chalcone isomerase family protein [Alphaproteobacteria bacterium]|nr:chalcone isomerase family protein [Alphaproteobacteria bacterium]